MSSTLNTNIYYDETSFPSYEFLESLNVQYLNREVYEIVRQRYINRAVPPQLTSTIPRKYKNLSWPQYAIIRAIRFV